MKQKIPEQLFVVSKLHTEREYIKDANGDYSWSIISTSKFGFLHPWSTRQTDASRKRENTQLKWAYDGASYLTPEGQWRHKGSTSNWKPVEKRVPGGVNYEIEEWDKPIDTEYAPRIWCNEPLTGFKIIDTVCRYRGNKLFKVSDPRGVDFEITAVCLFNLLMNGTVQNGEIINPCVWAGNKNLVIYT